MAILYHGSAGLYAELLPPAATGNLASGEHGRRCGGGYIYASGDVAHAREYAAGRGCRSGYLYALEVAATAARPLADLRQTFGGRPRRGGGTTYAVRPEDITIIGVYEVRTRRGQRPEIRALGRDQ